MSLISKIVIVPSVPSRRVGVSALGCGLTSFDGGTSRAGQGVSANQRLQLRCVWILEAD